MGSGIELASYHLIVPSKSLSGHEIPSTFFFTYLIKAQIIFSTFPTTTFSHF